eukprot:3326478-Prymnesium_polylepis.1
MRREPWANLCELGAGTFRESVANMCEPVANLRELARIREPVAIRKFVANPRICCESAANPSNPLRTCAAVVCSVSMLFRCAAAQ